MKRALGAITALVLAFAAITWWALESSEVAVIETRAPDGSMRSTHVWYVEPGGTLLLEAGTPDNPWFVDAKQRQRVRLTVGDTSAEYIAEPLPGKPDHDRVRALLREKYSWRDAWVGLLVDTSGSIAVVLRPADP
jgi:hypothetical protein